MFFVSNFDYAVRCCNISHFFQRQNHWSTTCNERQVIIDSLCTAIEYKKTKKKILAHCSCNPHFQFNLFQFKNFIAYSSTLSICAYLFFLLKNYWIPSHFHNHLSHCHKTTKITRSIPLEATNNNHHHQDISIPSTCKWSTNITRQNFAAPMEAVKQIDTKKYQYSKVISIFIFAAYYKDVTGLSKDHIRKQTKDWCRCLKKVRGSGKILNVLWCWEWLKRIFWSIVRNFRVFYVNYNLHTRYLLNFTLSKKYWKSFKPFNHSNLLKNSKNRAKPNSAFYSENALKRIFLTHLPAI